MSQGADTQAKIMGKPLIIFDWDGTLMDSIGLITESMHVAAAHFGFTTTDTEVKSIIGLSLTKAIEQLFPLASALQIEAIERRYAEYYIANSHKTPFFTGIEAMLQQLQRAGKTLAVATGKKRAGLDRVMSASNSHHYFAVSKCADESRGKPDPQMLIDILEETGFSVEQAVLVGDSIHDIDMANALGMMSVAVEYGAGIKDSLRRARPTVQLATPEALIELFKPQ